VRPPAEPPRLVGRILRLPERPRPRVLVTLSNSREALDEERIRTQLAGEGYLMVRWQCEPATGYPPHAHIYPETMVLLRGNLALILPDEGRMLDITPGDRVEIPRGLSHGTMAGAEGAVYLVGTR